MFQLQRMEKNQTKEYKTDGEVVEPETEAEEKTTNGVF